MTADIVPIELGLTDGNLVTLWAPLWREDDEEWQAFLGSDDDLFGFESIADLTAFVRGGADNDLTDHPRWRTVRELSASEFEPAEENRYDLVGVLELVAGNPTEQDIDRLRGAMEIARTIGEVCELKPVEQFFTSNPDVAAVFDGVEPFYGRDGATLWRRIGAAVGNGWDEVLDAIDSVVTTPDVDAALVPVAQAELDAPDPIEDDEDDIETDDVETDTGDVEESESFWESVGIDPIRIITGDHTFVTLRCYVDESPIFLGRQGMILVFGNERGLARYLADDHDHDLAGLSTYLAVHTAATDGSLHVEVSDDNVYVLPGIADDLRAGPDDVDLDQLDLSVELFSDAADYAGDESVEEALAANVPLGRYVSYLLDGDNDAAPPHRAPFILEAEAWRALEHQFEGRLRRG